MHVREQAAAEIVGLLNAERIHDLGQQIHTQDGAFRLALDEIKRVKEFIGAPEHILGRMNTKHGEVAEHLQVGVRRAYDALNQMPFSATFEGVGRIAPEDYKLDGVDVQSKYINGARNTLDHVREHLDKYPWFGEQSQFYHVSKDQYEQIEMAYRGMTPPGLSDGSAQKLREKIQDVLERTGKPFEEIIRPGSYEYKEVQLGVAQNTLGREEQGIRRDQEEIKNSIKTEHQPGLSEAAEAAAIAAVLAAGLNLGYGLYKKSKAGKSIFKLTADDWKELGIDSAKAGAGGAGVAAVIYGLTNYSGMSAPLAAAIASTARGVYSQAELYRNGKLTKGQLIDNSIALSGEAGIVALCSVAGQAAIPIPILGGVIGSIVGKFVSKLLVDYLGEDGKKLAKLISDRTAVALDQLSTHYRRLVARFMATFDALDDLITRAFDPKLNQKLVELSIETARKLGVPEHNILVTAEQCDRYFID